MTARDGRAYRAASKWQFGPRGGGRRVLSMARPRDISLAGHDQFDDQPLLAVGAGVELAMDDLPAVVLDPADGPRRRRAWIPVLLVEGPAEEDDLPAVEGLAAAAERHPRLARVGPDAGELARRRLEPD